MSERYAIVEDGVVVNVVVWNGSDPWTPQAGDVRPCGDAVGIGWTFGNGVFAPPAASDEGATS